jgi:hypothetical protein
MKLAMQKKNEMGLTQNSPATSFRIVENLAIPRKQKLRKLLICIEFNNI